MKCNKNILLIILFLVSGLGLFSQAGKYNNRWINYTQKYYKMKIPEDGIYKVDSATLAAAGVPVATFSPRNIQLFQRGVEIYPYIAGENDDTLNTNDYILFYAEKNKSTHDSLLYTYNIHGASYGVPFLTNPYFSVVNDSATVFLTWDNTVNHNRLIVDTDTSYSTYTVSPYYYKEAITSYGAYSPGQLNIVNQADPRFTLGEGFYYSQVAQPPYYNVVSFTIPTALAYKSGPPAFFTICVSGANDIAAAQYDHIYNIQYVDGTGTAQNLMTAPDTTSAYNTKKYTYTVNPSTFGNSTDILVNNLANPYTSIEDDINVNYMTAFYPHQFNMLGDTLQKIYLPDDAQGKSNLVITNLTGVSPVMIDVTNHHLIKITQSGSNYLALVQNSGGNKFCYLAAQQSVRKVRNVIPVNKNNTPGATPGSFVNYFAGGVKDSVYIIVSNPKLMAPGMHGVSDYKNWRTSGVGGGNFNVILASITDLVDQFAFGVDNNPLGIRNFCSYLIDTAIAEGKKMPSNLFLIGKGIHPQDMLVTNGIFYTPAQAADRCFVPTWGNPASDILITQGLPGSVHLEPAIPTGRLAAKNDGDILAYLSKAELHEQQTDIGLWKKQAIHFIGGNTQYDQHLFETYMSTCKNIFQDTAMGGDVFTFRKTTSAPTGVTTNDSVRLLINNGVSLITFFGHGSNAGFDENLDDPQTYSNSPRFPFVIANSCFTGDINNSEELSHSEVFTLAPNNHGGIGYIATVTEGVANFLAPYSQEMYRQLCYKNYGRSYGTSVKNTVRKLMQDLSAVYANDTMLILTALQMTLHGDPALNPYSFTEPDYTLTNSDVIFKPSFTDDSIEVKIIMTNLGKAVKQITPYVVFIQRTFPNGDIVKYYKTIPPPLYKDTLTFKVAYDYYRAVGKNDFFISIDDNHLYTEVDETNNTTLGPNNTPGPVSLFIKGADIEPVWPYKYAIVPDTAKVILKASTADPFAPLTNYRFQVDTNDKFSSLLTNTLVNAPGGVVSLPVNLYNKDSVVYFWRVKNDTSSIWKESSFQVVKGKYGWGQAHFNQFKHDTYQYVRYDSLQRNFDFFNTVNTITVKDIVCYFPWINYDQTMFFYNGNREQLWSCAPNGWSFARFDPVTANIIPTRTVSAAPGYNSYYGPKQECICDLTTLNVIDFGNQDKCGDSTMFDYRDSLVSFINALPDSTPILAYTVKYDTYGNVFNNFPVSNAMLNAFHSIGSAQIDNLIDTTSLIIFGKKGWAPGKAHEVLSQGAHDQITLNDSIVPHFSNGYIKSEIIGPCKYSDTAWGSLHWHYKTMEQPFASKEICAMLLK